MQIELRGHIKATDAIRQHIDRRLLSGIGRFEQHVRGVIVRLDDTNGPSRGGADKSCHIEVTLDTQRRSPIVVEEVNQDLYAAISQAAERLSVAVGREIDRVHHDRSKSSVTAP
ncbi:MAG: HPF/RaiA family ribosome-associated protein [Acidobacteria bacterium]|nr:HPF/RaiA family ribosome-associated protein [Acidobacteriota bacterium]